MFIRPVYVSNQWLQDNTKRRLALPQVETKERGASILTTGALFFTLPYVFESVNRFDRLTSAAESEIIVGTGKNGQFKTPIIEEESLDEPRTMLGLCTDEKSDTNRGVLFTTLEAAHAFSERYKSLDDYFNSKLHKQAPSEEGLNYLLLSENTLAIFRNELKTSKQKSLAMGEYHLTAAGSFNQLTSPDGSRWVMVALKKGVDAKATFPKSHFIHNLLLEKSDQKAFGKLDLPPEMKNEKSSSSSCLPFWGRKAKKVEAPARQQEDENNSLTEMRAV
ncbi:hypothetical protein Lbir_1681 [Legionella birminghamensis]|uniref:Uncharacterized protein n=1 Tax=Legionella birminghamensis TaxID=28083 RepID=A0A378I764_9GAMM|nr:hypothetical protein [Legionella birminghamensis]KTC71529.1 hypothetical protein Lbir_1681 [Legionella birminghamensis]STX30863.1 Uncharacterised protein [Legionella birminghamensis]